MSEGLTNQLLADRDALKQQLLAAELENKRLREALLAKIKMEGRGGKHGKLDEAISWRENDEIAQRLAEKALSSPGHSQLSGLYLELKERATKLESRHAEGCAVRPNNTINLCVCGLQEVSDILKRIKEVS